MTAQARVHVADKLYGRPCCGFESANVTPTITEATCKRCLNIMRELPRAANTIMARYQSRQLQDYEGNLTRALECQGFTHVQASRSAQYALINAHSALLAHASKHAHRETLGAVNDDDRDDQEERDDIDW